MGRWPSDLKGERGEKGGQQKKKDPEAHKTKREAGLLIMGKIRWRGDAEISKKKKGKG